MCMAFLWCVRVCVSTLVFVVYVLQDTAVAKHYSLYTMTYIQGTPMGINTYWPQVCVIVCVCLCVGAL